MGAGSYYGSLGRRVLAQPTPPPPTHRPDPDDNELNVILTGVPAVLPPPISSFIGFFSKPSKLSVGPSVRPQPPFAAPGMLLQPLPCKPAAAAAPMHRDPCAPIAPQPPLSYFDPTSKLISEVTPRVWYHSSSKAASPVSLWMISVQKDTVIPGSAGGRRVAVPRHPPVCPFSPIHFLQVPLPLTFSSNPINIFCFVLVFSFHFKCQPNF